MKVPLTTIYENLNFASDRLSTQIRTLTLGVLALVCLFLSGGKDVPALMLRATNEALLAIAALRVLTLFIDAAQYWASYLSSNAVRREAESENRTEAEYNETSLLRRLQQGCFWAKQVPAEPQLTLPGFAFVYAMSSVTLFGENFGFVTTMSVE